MASKSRKAASNAVSLELLKEIESKLTDIDQKLDHFIRNLRRFNHSHFNSVDESV
jgi:hypothetical protein